VAWVPPIGLFLVALAVMTVAAWLTHHFLVEQKLAIPAGLMVALVVAAAPLAVYGLQRTLGYAGQPFDATVARPGPRLGNST
jgi:hypothetical protein